MKQLAAPRLGKKNKNPKDLSISVTYLQAVSSLPLQHCAQLPLGVTAVLPQRCCKKVALAAGQEEGARQTKEGIRRGGVHSVRLEMELLR